MVRQGMRTKLRFAIQQASEENARIVISGGRTTEEGHTGTFNIAVHPVPNDGDQLLLVCFVDEPRQEPHEVGPTTESRSPGRRTRTRVGGDRMELQGAIHNLEISSEGQKAINEETLSSQEEYQSTNEELLTSRKNCSP